MRLALNAQPVDDVTPDVVAATEPALAGIPGQPALAGIPGQPALAGIQGQPTLAGVPAQPVIALLSNPRSTGNLAMLPAVRTFVAAHPNIFHYEVDDVAEIPAALRSIARMKPVVLAINGGDGTVQKALTELYHGGHFGESIPPVAVLPNGKTNLIAQDLGATGNPLVALDHLLTITRGGLDSRLVQRPLIELTDGSVGSVPVLGMFLGGAGLAEMILYCRHKIYPLGLPNWLSHLVTVLALMLSGILRAPVRWLPKGALKLRVSVVRHGRLEGKFLFLMVTTLDRVLLNTRTQATQPGTMKLMAIEHGPATVLRSGWAMLFGRLGHTPVEGVHLDGGDEIRIDGERPSVILDGEFYQAAKGGSIVLRTTAPVEFVSLAA
ncbi:MAG: diacylglycerol/lipid kinase family protein [Janthinobacterium lividum]